VSYRQLGNLKVVPMSIPEACGEDFKEASSDSDVKSEGKDSSGRSKRSDSSSSMAIGGGVDGRDGG